MTLMKCGTGSSTSSPPSRDYPNCFTDSEIGLLPIPKLRRLPPISPGGSNDMDDITTLTNQMVCHLQQMAIEASQCPSLKYEYGLRCYARYLHSINITYFEKNEAENPITYGLKLKLKAAGYTVDFNEEYPYPSKKRFDL